MTDGRAEREMSRQPDRAVTRRDALKLALFVPVGREGEAPTTSGQAADTPSGGETGTKTAGTSARRAGTLVGAGPHVDSVALDGTTALLGVPPATDATGPSVGSAVVLTRTDGTWRRQATLPADGDGGQFGRAVAIDGDTAVIGGEFGPDPASTHAGSATVFTRDDDAWTRQVTLTAPGPGGMDFFGTAVAVGDGTVLVGASEATTASRRRSGAAYAYARSDDAWIRTATLAPPADDVDEFGRALAFDGDTAVVGARRTTGAGPGNCGVAFVYRRSGRDWRRMARLAPRGRDRDDGFGTTLAADGGTIVAGAPTETNELGQNAGAVYAFRRSRGRWYREAILQDEGGGTDHRFGTDVALDGDALLVGTGFGDGPVAYARERGSWTRRTVLAPDEGAHPGPGTAVALSEGNAVVVEGRAPRPAGPGGSVEVFGP